MANRKLPNDELTTAVLGDLQAPLRAKTGDAAANSEQSDRMGGRIGISVRGLIGPSILQLEWVMVAVRTIWVSVVVVLIAFWADMESVRVVWLIACFIAAATGVGVAFVLRAGAIREAALLGMSLDAVVVTGLVPATYFLASRDDPANLWIATQPAFIVTTLIVATAGLRLRLRPAIIFGLFLTVVPVLLASQVADGELRGDVLGTSALRIAVGALIFGMLGQVLQRTRPGLAGDEEQQNYAEAHKVLSEISRLAVSEPDLNVIYQKLATTAMKVIPSDRMQLLLLEEDGKSLSARQLWGDQIPGRETGNRFPLSGTLSEYVFNKRRAVSWSATQDFDVDAGAVPGMDPVRRAGVQATIGVPLMMHGEPIGVLFFNRFEDRSYTPQEITIASDIGDQITNVVVNFRSRQ